MAAIRSEHSGRPKDFTLEWNGAEILGRAAEAARRGINEVAKAGADTARTIHPWENQSFQTEHSVFPNPADVVWAGDAEIEIDPLVHVWGEWGVREYPRFHSETGNLQTVTTKDVALFLEFGTVKMEARPWLYPAWDATKGLLPEAIRRHWIEIGPHWRPRDLTTGQFRAFTEMTGG